MSSKYFKNFFLCGETAYYCLICSELCLSTTEMDQHIVERENHKKYMKEQKLKKGYEKNFIYQIHNRFYCTLCNTITTCDHTLKTHIVSDQHVTRKRDPGRDWESINEHFVYVDNCFRRPTYSVHEEVWNTVKDRCCMICSVVKGQNVKGDAKHLDMMNHTIKIVESKVFCHTAEESENWYRQLNEYFVYCFLCECILPLANIYQHVKDEYHSTLQYSYKMKALGIFVPSDIMVNIVQKREKIKKQFAIEEIKYTAVCKKCGEYLHADINIMSEHKNNCKGTQEERTQLEKRELLKVFKDHGKMRMNVALYADDHEMVLNLGGSQGYCGQCHMVVTPSLKMFKDHITGVRHKSFLELKAETEVTTHKLPTVKLAKILDYIRVLHYSSSMHSIIINGSTSVNVFNFALITRLRKFKYSNLTKCFICDTFYDIGKDHEHVSSDYHKIKFLETKVLTLKHEFIREIQPNVYHCGACAQIYPYWEIMDKHLKSFKHYTARRKQLKMIEFAASKPNKFRKLKLTDRVDLVYETLMNLNMFKDFEVKPKPK